MIKVNRHTFFMAGAERLAGATGSRVSLAAWASSANINGAHAWRMCHST